MADGIHAKAQALSPNRLAQLCVSAGGDAGCGSLASIAAKLSNSEAIVYKKRCRSVLRNPKAYENDIVQICKLIN